jgi:hypothetical protein
MPVNDQANDRYNPPGIGTEFEHFRFSDINVHELFWLSDDSNSNKNRPYRKINETQGQNVKTREIITVDSRTHSYQKT